MKKGIIKKTVMAALTLAAVGLLAFPAYADWEQNDGSWYYRGTDGENLTNNWVMSDGKNYYLGSDGTMLTGRQKITYRDCVFDDTGAFTGEYLPLHVEGLDDEKLEKAREKVNTYWPAILTAYDMINEERAKHDAAPVILNYDMCIAAAYRCQQMLEMGNYYSGPDENGEMLWNTVPRLLLNEPDYVGTENKSHAGGIGSYTFSDYDSGVFALTGILQDQFTSPTHYAQIIGEEYTQIGIGLYFAPDYSEYYIAEVIRVGK